MSWHLTRHFFSGVLDIFVNKNSGLVNYVLSYKTQYMHFVFSISMGFIAHLLWQTNVCFRNINF